jgi:cell division protein FtsB
MNAARRGMNMWRKENLSPMIKMCTGIVVIFFVVLGGLRFYAGNLEIQLAGISRQMENLSQEEVHLKQEFSTITSQLYVYQFCQEKLGMKKAENMDRVEVPKKSANTTVAYIKPAL